MERRRRILASLVAVALVLIVVGFTLALVDPGFGGGSDSSASASPSASAGGSATPDPSASGSILPSGSGSSSSVGPSPSPSQSPSAGPTAKLGYVAVDGGFEWHGTDGIVVPVQAVAGLTVQIQSGRAIYYALPSNRYGLKSGSYAGEFMPGVTMGQLDGSSAQTGGIVLTGPVVARLTNDSLGAAKTDGDRWVVALPVDIRNERASTVDVSFDRFGLAGWTDTPRVLVRFTGSLPLVETVPTNGGFHALVEGIGITGWQVIDPIRIGLPHDELDAGHLMNELLIYGDGSPSTSRNRYWDGRAPVGTQIMSVSGDVSVSLVVQESHADLGPDKVLKVGEVPVFVAAG